MKTIKEFVAQIISGDNIGARETFQSLVAEKSMEALSGRKQEIAQTLFQTEDTNLDEENLDEALANWNNSAGEFTHSKTGKHFTYKNADHPWAKEHNLPHQIAVGPNAEETRFAHVKGTVAHVAVDENPDGTPKLEKWTIKNHSKHVREGVEIDEETYHVINKKSRMPGTVSSRAGQNIAGVTIKDKYHDRKEAAAHAKHLDKHGSSVGHEVSTWVNGKLQEDVEIEEGNAENKEKKNLHFDKMGANWKKLNPRHDFPQNDRNLGRGVNTYGNKKQVKAAQQAEEIEQVDELSVPTLSSYIKKRAKDLKGGYGDHKPLDGINRALKKVAKQQNQTKNEEIEQVDELSSKTTASYIKSAARNLRDAPFNDYKRIPGIDRAVEKLKKSKPDPVVKSQYGDMWDDD